MVSPRFLRSVGGVANVGIDFETDRAAKENGISPNEIESLNLVAFKSFTGKIVKLSADEASYEQEPK